MKLWAKPKRPLRRLLISSHSLPQRQRLEIVGIGSRSARLDLLSRTALSFVDSFACQGY